MPAPTTARIKGLATGSIRKWLRRQYGEETYQTLVAAMTPEDRDVLESAWATSWVPVTALDSLWSGAVAELALEHGQLDADFRQQGIFVAGDNLSGVLRSVLTFFVNAQQLFGLVPRLWSMYFSGVEVVTRLHDDGLGGEVVVSGLGDLRCVAPVVCGWMCGALESVDATAIVTEQAFEKGELAADPLRFNVRWTQK